jgi:hypothetical protein
MATIHPFQCKAGGCRFPNSHMTFKHRCGNCGETGHGILECGRWSRLIDIATIRTAEGASCPTTPFCQVIGCLDPNTHTTSAHHCTHCNIRNGTEGHDCIFHEVIDQGDPPRSVSGCVQQLLRNGILDTIEQNSYTKYAEARGLDGSVRFVIRSMDRIWHFSNSVETLPHETLLWIRGKLLVFTWVEPPESPPPRSPTPPPVPPSPPGHFDIPYYDYASSDEGNTDAPTECPVCRTGVSRSGGVIPLYGLDIKDKCSVCLENQVDMVFVACGHAVVCSECAERWIC